MIEGIMSIFSIIGKIAVSNKRMCLGLAYTPKKYRVIQSRDK